MYFFLHFNVRVVKMFEREEEDLQYMNLKMPLSNSSSHLHFIVHLNRNQNYKYVKICGKEKCFHYHTKGQVH